MVKKSIDGASAPGRLPPPAATRFKKGQSANPRGRPKGARSIEAMTRNFALRTQPINIGGRPQRLCALEIALYILKAQAADGKPMAVRLLNQLRARIIPAASDSEVLLVPAALTAEEWIARVEENNKTAVEPGSAVNIEAEEFIKAAQGKSATELGAALLAHHRKYRPQN
jgi:hypothetical protein